MAVRERVADAGRQDGGNRCRHVVVIHAVVRRRRREFAAQPQHREAPDLEVQVRGATLNGDFQ